MCLVWTWNHMKYGTYLSPDVGPPALPSYMIQGTNTTECLRKSTWRRLNNTALVCPPADRNNYSGSDQSLGREHWKLCLVYRECGHWPADETQQEAAFVLCRHQSTRCHHPAIGQHQRPWFLRYVAPFSTSAKTSLQICLILC